LYSLFLADEYQAISFTAMFKEGVMEYADDMLRKHNIVSLGPRY
jgi:hypothetical protein